MRFQAKQNNQRKGAATVELAICLPIIALIVFGAIEASSLVFLKQALVQSAYEGVKVAVDPEASNNDADAAAFAVINGRNLEDATVQFEPSDVENLPRGTIITATVSAPGNANSFLPFQMFNNQTVSAQAVMVKE